MIAGCLLIFFISLTATFVMRRYALRKQILDIPNERSSHEIPVPRGGGCAIMFSFTLASIYLFYVDQMPANLFYALTGGGIVLGIIGFCDDIYRIKNRWRLALHFLAAAWAVYWLGGFSVLDLGTFKFLLKSQGSLLAVIGIVWLINLYNFMDGIDGLAGIEGLTTAAAAGAALLLLEFPDYAAMMFLLAAAIAGFTLLNWPPAKIFLGDAGSGYLGYIFAVIGIATAKINALPITFWLIVLAVFICDATFTIVYRAWHGKKVYTAHREHAYQHVHIYGASHKQISSAIFIINLFVLFPIAMMTLIQPAFAFWYLSAILIACFGTWFVIKKLPLTNEVNA